MTSVTSRNLTRTALKQLRSTGSTTQILRSTSRASGGLITDAQSKQTSQRPSAIARFSTMAALRSSAPAAAAAPREYDPEIKDIASYVHSYKIDSDLAVSPLAHYIILIVLLVLIG